jgi:hypothetical protein
MEKLKLAAVVIFHLAAFGLLLVAIEPWLPDNRILAAVIGLVVYNLLCLQSIYTRLLTYRRAEPSQYRGISKS